MPPRDRASTADAGPLALHAQRLDQLEEGQDSILEALHGDAQAPGLLAQLALQRQATEALTRAVEGLRAELREARKQVDEEKTAELKAKLERRALPTRSQVAVVLLGAFLALGCGWVGANLLPRLPQGAGAAGGQAGR